MSDEVLSHFIATILAFMIGLLFGTNFGIQKGYNQAIDKYVIQKHIGGKSNGN
jgi:ABC-type proline/glycine betaine transport system permease subunit